MNYWPECRPFVPWIITMVSLSYVFYINYKYKRNQNPINKEFEFKRKHVIKANNLEKGKKLSLCRCWKSVTFPLCDGTHKQHNKDNNDCVGPVVIEWDEEIFDELRIEDNSSMNASTDEPLSSLEMIEDNENGNNSSEA